MRIARYLLKYKWQVLLVLCLLVVQAYCDLSLPAYTSDIVDVGIQNGGIEYATPEKLREETLSELELLLTDGDIARVEAAYALDSDGVFVLQNEADKEALDGTFRMPMAILARISASGDMDISRIQAAVDAGMMTKEQLMTQVNQALSSIGQLPESIVQAAAISFLQQEYAALGMDLNQIRMDYLWNIGTKMVALTFLMIIMAIGAGLIGSRVAASIGRDLREGVFARVLSFSSAEIGRFSAASLITRSTNDIQQIQMVSVMLLRIVLYAPILGIGGVLKVAATRTGMGWIVGVGIGALLLVIGILMAVAMPKFRKMQSLIDRLNLVSREILTGLPVIRAFHRERYEEGRFEEANRALMKTQLFTNRAMAFMMPMMMFLMFGITVMIEWFGAKGSDLGNLQVGDMIAFITYSMMIVMAFMMITMISIFLPRATVAAGRIDEVIETKPGIRDPEKPLDDALRGAKGLVTFEDVSFQYPGAENELLSGIRFSAEPGRTTAIIGSTGCGKSTLINLLLRFYDVSGGRIAIDGVDIRDISQHRLASCSAKCPEQACSFPAT
jgi:ATP-binding cassette subfamily B protein